MNAPLILLYLGAACFFVAVGIAAVLMVTTWMTGVPDHEGHELPDVIEGHGYDFYPEVEDVDLPDVLPTHGTSVSDDTGEWLALNQGRVELPGPDKE